MYQIGVDIGGTTIKIGLVDDELNIIGRSIIPFPHIGGEGVARELADAVRKLLAEHGITEQALRHVGVVVPGSIDPTGEIVLNAHNLGFHDVPFKKLLEEQFPNHAVYLANDADGAALAELGRGAFMGCRTAILLTLGTGVGGGVILNGKMFSGGCRRGCELGHMQLVAGGGAGERRLAEVAQHNVVGKVDTQNDDVVEHQDAAQREEVFIKAFVFCKQHNDRYSS